MKNLLFLLTALFAANIISAQNWNPRHPSWTDSHAANGFCWCNTTNFDHNLDSKSLRINNTNYNIVDVCDELESHPLYRAYQNGDAPYNDIQCGNGPANDAADEEGCPGRTDLGSGGCDDIGPTYDMDWLESRTRFGGSNTSPTPTPTPTPTTNFSPDPNKSYYIDVPVHNLRLAANGSSEDVYTTSTNTTGADVEWKFVSNGNGSWFIDRVAGGALPRLRTDQTEFADMQANSFNGSWESFTISDGDSNGTYFLTTGINSEHSRLQVDKFDDVLMVGTERNGTWESFRITEAGNISTPSTGSSSLVRIVKRNADYAIHSSGSGADEQDVTLWQSSHPSVNLNWIEIDRGNGYFSYQRENTNHCIDGGAGGARNQNVYLWTCNASNQNQQWQKVDAGGGAVKLVKRNASNFALNAGNNGANGQNVNLYDASNSSQNLQWFINPVGSAKSIASLASNEELSVYPNPVSFFVTVSIDSDEVLENVTYSISDLSGRVVRYDSSSEGIQTIDMRNLNSGMYLLEVNSGSKKYMKKIVKK